MMISPEELKRRRLSLGMTQKALANSIRVSQSILSKFEAKKNYPGYHTLKQIEENLSRIEHKSERTVETIMVKHIYSLRTSDRVKDAIRLFKAHGYSQAPVLEGGRVVGMVTAQTLLDADHNSLLKDVIEPEPPIIHKDAPISSARALLKGFPMVLVSDKGKLLGLIAREDVL